MSGVAFALYGPSAALRDAARGRGQCARESAERIAELERKLAAKESEIETAKQKAMAYVQELLADKKELTNKLKQVDALHEQYLQAIRALFDTHKAAVGWGHKTIRFC